jgi:2-dehydropantoate 2-reductase
MALRLFDGVYAAYVYVFAAITEPGVVSCYTSPCFGIIDFGGYPTGTDDRAVRLAGDFAAAGFHSIARPDVMTWKRGKLLVNTANVIRAACPPKDQPEDIILETKHEAERCFAAAHLDFVSVDDVLRYGKEFLTMQRMDGRPFPGGSTAQGMARGANTSEVDYLNGEVSLLGRMLGVPTPVNAALQRVMREMIKSGAAPGSMSAEELRLRVRRA